MTFLASVCPEEIHAQNCSGLLDFNATLLVQLVIFLVMAWLLWQLLWKPIVAVLQARDDALEAGRRAAEEADRKLADASAHVTRTVDEAKLAARAEVGDVVKSASMKAEEERKRARTKADAELEAARSVVHDEQVAAARDLEGRIESLVAAAAERVSGAPVDVSKHRDSIRKVSSR